MGGRRRSDMAGVELIPGHRCGQPLPPCRVARIAGRPGIDDTGLLIVHDAVDAPGDIIGDKVFLKVPGDVRRIALERVGADILFAAGNCGADCPDGRCQGVTANAIYGANGHPAVLTIAGVDTSNTRVGYSTQGPGRLARNKPDLSGYTHFRGSQVYAADGGTSAATPVVAGVVAAVRTRRPFQVGNPSASPASIRALMRSTARDLGAAGFDFDHGFGVVGGCALARRFSPIGPIDICRRFPRICERRPIPIDICRRYPQICREIIREPIPPIPPIPPIDRPPGPGPMPGEWSESPDEGGLDLGDIDLGELLDAVFEAGYYDAQQGRRASAEFAASQGGGGGGCGCGGKSPY